MAPAPTIWFALLAIAGIALAQEQAASPPSEVGAKIERIIDSYQRESSGAPFADENGWGRLVQELQEVRRVLPHEFIFDDKLPLDFSVLYDQARAKDRKDEGLDLAAIESKASAALKNLEDQGLFDAFAWITTHRRFARPGPSGRALDWEMPELSPARHLCSALAARMVLAAKAGEWQRVTLSFELMLAVGRVLMHQPMMIERLVGVSVRHLATKGLRRVLLNYRPPAAVLEEIHAALDRQLHTPPVTLVIECERLSSLDAIDQIYKDKDAELLTRLGSLFDETWTKKDAKFLRAVLVPIEQTNAKVNESYDRLARAAKLTPRESISNAIEFKQEKEDWPLGLGAAQIVIIDAERLFVTGVQHDAEVAGTRVMLAIERFRASEGRLLGTLEELAPRFIGGLPDDPYTGRGFIFKSVPDDRNASGGYLLYSPGYDQQDDGGIVHARGAGAAANPKTTGPCDYVFNVID